MAALSTFGSFYDDLYSLKTSHQCVECFSISWVKPFNMSSVCINSTIWEKLNISCSIIELFPQKVDHVSLWAIKKPSKMFFIKIVSQVAAENYIINRVLEKSARKTLIQKFYKQSTKFSIQGVLCMYLSDTRFVRWHELVVESVFQNDSCISKIQ